MQAKARFVFTARKPQRQQIFPACEMSSFISRKSSSVDNHNCKIAMQTPIYDGLITKEVEK